MSSTRQDARYRDISLLGSGGMAHVSLAEDTVLGRLVALKRVHATDDPRGLTRLRREALVGASLNHPNLVSVYDVVTEADGDLTIVMQYIAGNTLRDVIRSGPMRPLREALRILEGVASGLDAIHARGIVHRDVKPGNVLLGTDGAVKLADLGIAAVAERTQITTAGAVLGTFRYMAPEQLDGRPSRPAVDIYALSAVAFEMLSGHKARPEPNPLALAHAIATRPSPDLRDRWSQAPAEAAAVLQRGMAFDPATRPRSAGDLVCRLAAALDPQSTSAMAAPAPQQPPRQPRALPRNQPRALPDVAHSGRMRGRRAGLPLALLATVVAAGALVATLGTGGATPGSRSAASKRAGAKAPRTGRRTPVRGSSPASSSPVGASASSAGTATDAKTTPSSGQGAGPAGTTAGASAAVSGAAGGAATPAGAVQSFYASAARHDYLGAWGLADSNLRSQLAGFANFQSQMSAVRFIAFHQAQTLSGGHGSAATVAVRTTSQLAGRTEQCAGIVRTVRSSAATWLLDSVSIRCS